MADVEFRVRTIIAVCKGCHLERTFIPDEPLNSAEELIAWTERELTPCACGARTCDLKIPLPQVGIDPEKTK